MDIDTVNTSGRPLEFRLAVTRTGEPSEVVLNTTERVQDREIRNWDDIIADDGRYRIQIVLDNGTSWADETNFTRLAGPAGLHVQFDTERINATYWRT